MIKLNCKKKKKKEAKVHLVQFMYYYIFCFYISQCTSCLVLHLNCSDILKLLPEHLKKVIFCSELSLIKSSSLKGQFTQNQKSLFFLLPVVLFICLDCFGVLSSFSDIGCRDFCLLSNVMGVNSALNVVLTDPQKYMGKTQQ